MMKRSRVDEVQYGTRPGPGGVGGSGGGGGGCGGGGGVAVSSVGTTVTIGTGTGTIAGAIPSSHVSSGNLSVGITTSTAIAHHRILTPQHGGAQTIAYLPSTTPVAVSVAAANSTGTTIKTVDSATAGSAAANNASIHHIGTPAGATSVVSSVGSVASMQYSTSYVTTIPTNNTIKSTAEGGNVQLASSVATVTPGTTIQQSPTLQNQNSLRTRAVTPANQQQQQQQQQAQPPTQQNSISGITQPLITSTQQQTQSQPQAQIVSVTPHIGGVPVSASNSQAAAASSSSTPLAQQTVAPPRLKVEDALSYLDQVKFQYADQPQIYNNFLDIMKEFKSQCIDTPGVIQRVSTLFKGHTELIYGFNMFLPPGYKIEIHSDELGCSVPVVSMPSPTGAFSNTTLHASNMPPTTTAASSANLQNTLTKSGAIGSSGAVNLMTHGGTALPQTTIHALQAPTAQVACTNAGSTTITATGAQVSVVSAGANVPQNVTMAPVIATHLPQNYSRDRAESRPGAQASPVTAVTGHANEINTQHTSSGGQHNLHHIQQAHQSILLGETAGAAGGVIAGQGNQPVEFNHAITYVNKIKLRFQNQPEKYKKFLEILHTYQKEQKVIKEGAPNQTKTLTEQEVYTQVAKLFGQDEDLLREFGQFLPDATNHHHGNAINAQHAAYTNAKAGADYKTGRSGTTTVIGHSTALSGGAHITMSTATPANAALHLAGGTTLAQIGSTAGSHAAALGNLSSVNTSVSIKPFTNSTTAAGPHNVSNHVMHNVSSVGGRGNDLIYDKDHYQHTNVTGTTIHLAHSAVPNSAGLTMTPPSGTTIRASNLYEKDGSVSLHRTNNHITDAQKYNQISHGHAAITPLKQKSSPGSGAYGSQAVISVNSVSGNMGAGIARTNIGTGINYVSPQGTSSHHHIAGQRRSLNSSLEDSSNLGTGPPPSKRHKPIYRDVSFSEASRKCTISDAAFFDKVRKALRSPEVYDNFLRCLTLFNQEIVSKTELLHLVTPFLNKFPDLLRWFTDFLGPPVSQVTGTGNHSGSSSQHNMEGIPLPALHRQNQAHNIGGGSHLVVDRQGAGLGNQQNELSTVQEIDLASCKRLGASYCALPQSTIPKKCSGRTQLCREVLNDKWVSFPTWASEDSTFVTSRKTQFEETIYRTEDERFELDVVIETNSATIRVLEGVQKKLSRMPPEELSRFQLDDCLGGTSTTIHQRAIHRIYGDKAAEIIQGLKKNPAIAVPIILKRLKVKEEEWRNAQKGFNKVWREQNEKYYLKSLDHQAIFFKPNDMKALRSKNLFNEIETTYDERHEQDDNESVSGPHLILPYKDKTILDDAANLLIHHVKRQTSIQKQEKTKIKAILRQFVPDLFFSRRQPLSDDEREEDIFPFLLDSDPNKMDVDVTISRHAKSNQASTSAEATDTKDNYSTTTTTTTTIDNSSTNAAASNTAVSTTASSISEDKSTNLLIAAVEAFTTNKTADGKLDELPTTSKAAMAAAAAVTTQTAPTTGTNSSTATTSTSSSTAIKVEIKQESTEGADISAEIPLPPHALSNHLDEAYTLFFGNNNWYLFFRLHAILCERLHTMYKRAQILIAEEEQYKRTRRESTAMALRLKMKSEIQVEDFYSNFIDMLKNVLDGNTDTSTFEDSMREMFGIHAYISFTLDKVVSNAVRQLQNCVTEKSALECVELFHAEQRRGGAGGLCRLARKNYAAELAYQRKAEANLRDENCFKIFIYKIDCRVTIELLDTDSDESEKQTLNKAKSWNKYLDRLTNPATNVGTTAVTSNSTANANTPSGNTEVKVENAEEESTETHSSRKPRFLDRNKRRACLRAEQAATRLLQNHNNKNLTSTTGNEVTNNAQNKTASAAATSTNADSADSICKVFGAVNKRLPERVGSLPGTTEKYIISDRDEVKLNASGRQVFVINKNLKFFKLASVRRAKKSHPLVTKQKYMNFQKFIKKWLSENVTDIQQQQCQDWLLGKQLNEITTATTTTANKQKSTANSTNWSVLTKVILQQDNNRTPYRTYNRYKLFNNNNNNNNNNNVNTPTTGTSNKDIIISNQTNLSNNSDILKGNTGTASLSSTDNNNSSKNSAIENKVKQNTENSTANSMNELTTTTTTGSGTTTSTSIIGKSNATSNLAASNILSDTTSAISGSSNLSNNNQTSLTQTTTATLSQQSQPTSSGRPVES